jgi:hypothetical protein
MEQKSKADELSDMLDEIWAKLQSDIDAIKEELKKEGYNVLAICSKKVSLTQMQNRLGFVVTMPENKVKDLLKILKSELRGTLSTEFGLHKKMAVFVITIKYPGKRWALLYLVYYHTDAEPLIKELGKQGLFTFFTTENQRVVGWVSMGSHQLYLFSRYTNVNPIND